MEQFRRLPWWLRLFYYTVGPLGAFTAIIFLGSQPVLVVTGFHTRFPVATSGVAGLLSLLGVVVVGLEVGLRYSFDAGRHVRGAAGLVLRCGLSACLVGLPPLLVLDAFAAPHRLGIEILAGVLSTFAALGLACTLALLVHYLSRSYNLAARGGARRAVFLGGVVGYILLCQGFASPSASGLGAAAQWMVHVGRPGRSVLAWLQALPVTGWSAWVLDPRGGQLGAFALALLGLLALATVCCALAGWRAWGECISQSANSPWP